MESASGVRCEPGGVDFRLLDGTVGKAVRESRSLPEGRRRAWRLCDLRPPAIGNTSEHLIGP